jgi:response regulator NasT
MNTKTENRRHHLLLVDDDQVALEALQRGLGRAGFDVTSAESGEAALVFARDAKFDLALVDMRMPGMSGARLANQLLTEFGCFSLILSAHSEPDDVSTAMHDGALGYLLKPFDVPRLAPTISAAIIRAKELASLIRNHEHLSNALQEGRETSMAVGILMERLHLDRQAAFERLREAARRRRTRIAEVAVEILASAEVLNLSNTDSR